MKKIIIRVLLVLLVSYPILNSTEMSGLLVDNLNAYVQFTPIMYYCVGMYVYAMNNNIQSLKIFSHITEKYKTSDYASKSQYMIGKTYVRMQNKLKAREEFQKILEEYPDTYIIIKAKERLVELNRELR